jgi:hypothetical protein
MKEKLTESSQSIYVKIAKDACSIMSYIFVFCMAIFMIYDNLDKRVPNNEYKDNIEYVKDTYLEKLQLNFYSSKNALADSIDKYIGTVAPQSGMNAISFINECEEYDIDLFFVIAQCQLESNFATTGLGAKTRSAFNIKAYDGKSDTYMDRYKHPDMSIKPYLHVIKTTYLDHDTTELSLLDNYINHNGDRYASDPQYEAKLRGIYAKLSSKYSNIYKEYQKYKMLTSH